MQNASKKFLDMKPEQRAIRNAEKREIVLKLLSAAVIVDRELVANAIQTDLGAARKLLKQLQRDGYVIEHQTEFSNKKIYSLSSIGTLEYGGYKFDPRRSAGQIQHLLGLAWLTLMKSSDFDRWISDRELREMMQKLAVDSRWIGMPDAIGIRRAKDGGRGSATLFELELSIKSNSRRARFYFDLLSGRRQAFSNSDVTEIIFICPTARRSEGLARAIGNCVVNDDKSNQMLLRDSAHWGSFHFTTTANICSSDDDY